MFSTKCVYAKAQSQKEHKRDAVANRESETRKQIAPHNKKEKKTKKGIEETKRAARSHEPSIAFATKDPEQNRKSNEPENTEIHQTLGRKGRRDVQL